MRGSRVLSTTFGYLGLTVAALFFLLPLGGLFGHHQRHGHFWYRGRRRY